MNALLVQVSGHSPDPHRSGMNDSGFEKFFSLRLRVKFGTETYVYTQLYIVGTTFPGTAMPAMMAPSGGVRRGVPNGMEAPQRIPIIRSLEYWIPSDRTISR
jgi:hypothetical protein